MFFSIFSIHAINIDALVLNGKQPRLAILGVVKPIASDVVTGAPSAKGYTVGPSVFGESAVGRLCGGRRDTYLVFLGAGPPNLSGGGLSPRSISNNMS